MTPSSIPKPLKPDSKRIAAWRKLCRFLAAAPETAVEIHLNRFQNDMAAAVRSALRPDDPALDGNLSLIRALAVICGGFLDVDPFNPEWPGRDRLFVGGNESLPAALAATAATGHFPLSAVPDAAVDGIAMGGVPGLEAVPASAERALALGIESAAKSAVEKETWRRFCRAGREEDGGENGWEDSPALWNTYVAVGGKDIDAAFWDRAARADARHASGLTVIVSRDGNATRQSVAEYRVARGWETDRVDGSALFPLYQAMRKSAAGTGAIIVSGCMGDGAP